MLLLACVAPDSVPADRDGGGETGPDPDPGDSGSGSGGTGLLTLEGEAVVAEAWTGSETLRFAAELGLGETLCEIGVELASTGPRDDCAACAWAWELVLGAPEVRVGDRCAEAGYDEATVAALEGSGRAYGFAEEYLGHAAVLLQEVDGSWEAVAFADYEATRGALAYQVDLGYHPW